MRQVCLINPPQTALKQPKSYLPLGLAYLATSLLDKFEVLVSNQADKEAFKLPFLDTCGIYGITVTSATYPVIRGVVKALKKARKFVVLGGPHPSVAPDLVYGETECDLVVTGEAESIISRCLENGVRGIVHAGVVNNIDDCVPTRSVFDREDVVDYTGIHGSSRPSTTVMSTRGCPYKCKFCCRGHPMFTKLRFRSAENVYSEIRELNVNYGVEHISFVDECFTLNRKRVEKLASILRSSGFTFKCLCRADLLDRALISTLKASGCIQVDLGVESGSQRLLESVGKRLDVRRSKEAIRMLKDAGITVKTFLMYNLPSETEEDWRLTLAFLREAKPDKFTLMRFTPLHGSYFEYLGGSHAFYYPEDDEYHRRHKEVENAIAG